MGVQSLGVGRHIRAHGGTTMSDELQDAIRRHVALEWHVGNKHPIAGTDLSAPCSECEAIADRILALIQMGAPPVCAREPMPGAHLRGDGKWCAYLHNGTHCNKCGFTKKAEEPVAWMVKYRFADSGPCRVTVWNNVGDARAVAAGKRDCEGAKSSVIPLYARAPNATRRMGWKAREGA